MLWDGIFEVLAMCDFMSQSPPAGTCLMCTLQHSCHLGTVSMNTGMLLHARSPGGRPEGDKGFSFVEAGTPAEAFTERFVSVCFCVPVSSSPERWAVRGGLHGYLGSCEGDCRGAVSVSLAAEAPRAPYFRAQPRLRRCQRGHRYASYKWLQSESQMIKI